MALYTYTTQECEEDLRTHDFTSVVEKFAERIEDEQALGSVQRYPHPFLKRNIGRHGRLIMEERRIGEDTVYCFLRALIRGDGDYDNFMTLCDEGNAQTYLDKYAPPDVAITAYLRDRQQDDPVEPLPELSPKEYGYLNGISAGANGADESIVESRTWVERISREQVQRELRVRYGDLLEELVFDSDPDPAQTLVMSEIDNRYRILYRYFPKFGKWFIVAPLDPDDPDEDERKLRDTYGRIFQIDEEDANDLMLQEGLRSYPIIITLNEQLWLNTQESEEANLALSPEEVDVLSSVLSADSPGSEAYPLFINGRPGSGKSTVLLYLFSEHLHFHLKQIWRDGDLEVSTALAHPPLYLTYSDSLLNDAKRIVHDILRCDSEKAQSEYNLLEDRVQKSFDASFGHFRSYLHSLLPPGIRSEFKTEKYVDFAAFRRHFSKRLAQHPDIHVRNISPELAWHVIRTYIKGMRQDAQEYIDVDFYEHELPRNQQSVTRSTFKNVYVHVWEAHYRDLCDNHGYWDDQDLARCLLDLEQENTVDLARHFAVFCDEAQDFTKLELELIFRLSLFAKRRVDHFQLHRVPFAFAGDPFQTLNPTGFDWDATQASFHENIVRQLDPAGQANLAFNFQNLAFNYRSTRPIVQFCNLIQLMRGRAFHQRSLKPQKTWQIGPAADPVYYDISHPVCRQALQNEATLVIIVPCQEGEEEKYAQNDDFLRQIAWDAESKTIIRDVLSPMRAKGLQFKRVVLYKFGEYATSKYGSELEILTEPENKSSSKEETLPVEYFVNQLYVAASRPRQQLIIVDTQNGIEQFWPFAIDENQQELVDSYESRNKWSVSDITRILRGGRTNWEQSRDDARQLGQDFFVRGKHGADPYLMERAIQNFEYVGDEASAAEALALKHEYENNLTAAGDVYATRLERLDKAVDCYWKDDAFSEIVDLGNRRTELATSLRHRAASFMLGRNDARSTLKFIEHVYSETKGDIEVERAIVTDSKWHSILEYACQALAKHAENSEISDADWKRVWHQIDGLNEAGVAIPQSVALARIAYRAGHLSIAREILDKNSQDPEDSEDWIIKVFAETASYPENLLWLQDLGQHDRIIRIYLENRDKALSEHDQKRVFHAFLHEKDFDGAYDLASAAPKVADLLRLLNEVIRGRDNALSRKVAGTLLGHLVDEGHWEAAIQFANSLTVPGQHAGGKPREVEIRWDAVHRHALLIRKMARSSELGHATVRDQLNKISSYLSTHLMPASEELKLLVDAREAGAAFERAGKFVDSLAFYESVRNGAWGDDNDLKQWSRIRWLINKYRQAEYYDNENQRQRAIQEAKSHEKIWGISRTDVNDAPSYPLLDRFVLKTALPDKDRDQESASVPKGAALSSDQNNSRSSRTGASKSNVDAPTASDTSLSEDASNLDQTGVNRTLDDSSNNAELQEDSSAVTLSRDDNSDEAPESDTDASSLEEMNPDVEEVPVSISLDIAAGGHSYLGILHPSRRTLELRNTSSDDTLFVRASDSEIVDPMHALSLSRKQLSESRTRWLISEWELAIEIRASDDEATIHLQHLTTRQSILTLLV
ncbi:MAG: hypothetical protein WD356_06850 [Pseudomonadales bacterium]